MAKHHYWSFVRILKLALTGLSVGCVATGLWQEDWEMVRAALYPLTVLALVQLLPESHERLATASAKEEGASKAAAPQQEVKTKKTSYLDDDAIMTSTLLRRKQD